MSEIEEKRRVKDGDFSKRETIESLLGEMEEIEDVVIAIRYKNGDDGIRITTGEITKALGMLELAKLTILMSTEE